MMLGPVTIRPMRLGAMELAALFGGLAIGFGLAIWRTEPGHPAAGRLRWFAILASLLAMGFSTLG